MRCPNGAGTNLAADSVSVTHSEAVPLVSAPPHVLCCERATPDPVLPVLRPRASGAPTVADARGTTTKGPTCHALDELCGVLFAPKSNTDALVYK